MRSSTFGKMEIMTVAHPRWEEFLRRLDCQLPDQQNSCGHNFARTREALADMGDFDPFSTVEYLQECGAYCDCEVFFNVLSAADECNDWRQANFKVIRGDRMQTGGPLMSQPIPLSDENFANGAAVGIA